MACTGCGIFQKFFNGHNPHAGTTQESLCDVCFILSEDRTIKKTTYCASCKAWLCDECSAKWIKRIIAAFKRGWMTREEFEANKK